MHYAVSGTDLAYAVPGSEHVATVNDEVPPPYDAKDLLRDVRMSSTDLAYAAALILRHGRYAMPGTGMGYTASRLSSSLATFGTERAILVQHLSRCAVRGTELDCAATALCYALYSTELAHPRALLWAAMRSLVLKLAVLVLRYLVLRRAMRLLRRLGLRRDMDILVPGAELR
eukprot:2769162-Rhodomonas_salina.3